MEFHCGELFSRVGFIVTNLETDSRAVVRFYNKAGHGEATDQGRQTGGKDDAAELSPVPVQGGTPVAECARLQPGEPLAAAGAADEDRQLVSDAAFIWQSSRSQAICGDFFATYVQNPYNIAADYGPTSLDIPFMFTFNSVYRLPFGHGRKYVTSGPATRILGDWQINGIFVARGGLPFNPCCVGDIANAGGGSQRYNISGDPYLEQGWEWFNPSAFVVPASGTYATTGVNSLHGPHYWDADFSVFRDFRFSETKKLQFRAEFFNIFNHPNYSTPGCYNCDITSTTGRGNRDIQLVLKLLF